MHVLDRAFDHPLPLDPSAEQRRRLALKGKLLTAEERNACCQMVRPATILAWFRQLAAQKYDSSSIRWMDSCATRAT